MSVKGNNKTISSINYGSTSISKMYKGASLVFGSSGSDEPKPCFAVTDDITTYTATTYTDVYDNKTEKWYKKNNLNQYEKYGVLPTVTSIDDVTYYTGKLIIYDGHEYKWTGSEWSDLGEVTSRLPEGYTEVEYIENTSSAYIDTGVNGGTSMGFELDCILYSTQPNQWPQYFAGDKSIAGAKIWGNPSSSIYIANTSVTFGLENKADTRVKIKVNCSGEVYIDDKLVYTFANYGNWGTLTYWLFNSHGESSLNGYGKVYSLKMYDDEILIRNFIPCKDSSSVYGMYDIVNSKFYSSSNSSYSFTGGNEVSGNIPQEYDTKVAPANNVEYDTLAELKLMECPWDGMKAKVGDNHYIYHIDGGWVQRNKYIDIDFNDGQWMESTTGITDFDVYMSDQMYNKSGSKSFKITFCGYPEFEIHINTYDYNYSYDKCKVWALDSATGTTLLAETDSSAYNASPDNIEHYKPVIITNDGDEHFVWVTYIKTSNNSSNNYRAYCAIEQYEKETGKEWRLSQTEYLGSNGTYYEKYYEYITEDDETWAETGDIKQGNKLETADRIGTSEYLATAHGNGTSSAYLTATQKVYIDVITPDGTQRSTGYYKAGEALTVTDNISQTEYLGSNPYYQKIYYNITLPNGSVVTYNTSYYKQGEQLETVNRISTTEYLKVDDAYYQKVYVDPVTPDGTQRNTTNYIQGEELTPYTQDDGNTIISDGKRYHRLEVYVTVEGNAVKTTDYEIGDYIEDVFPEGYTQLSYIENTTYAYIDTGYIPNYKTRLKMKAQTVTSVQYARLAGSGAYTSSDGLQFDYEIGANGYLCVSYLGNTSWTQYSSIRGDYNIHEYDWNRNSFYRDGVLAGTGSESTLTASDNLGLFTYICSTTSGGHGLTNEHFKGKMYYCNIWDDDVLVREFIPVKDSSDVYGFYDCVNGVFYGSADSNYTFTGA